MRAPRLLVAPLVALALTSATPGRAAGPIIVNGAGAPLVWTANPIPFNPDLGTLGTRTNSQAVADVVANFGVWAAVATSTAAFANAGAMPVDVTVANYLDHLGVCDDDRSPIVFDTNGAITDDLFGPGASNSILGFAGPECGSYPDATITEGSAVLNGKWIDGVSSGSNPEMSLADFNSVFIHEFGHYVNLDHSQINRSEARDGNSSNDEAIATMYPFLVNGSAQATLHLDDLASLSTLYPQPSFATSLGRITGAILLPNGEGAFQGAYVIARKLGDPRLSAVGTASGALFFPANPGGPPPPELRAFYDISGLPAGSYTVEIEAIDPSFTGGSGLGPLDPPATLPGPPELWNGANESNANPPDDPASSVAIPVSGGETVGGINIVLNGVVNGPPNDVCQAPTEVATASFSTTIGTSAATTGIFDPFQSCSGGGPKQNSKSVWFSFTPASDGTLTAATAGSGYDTVLSVHTGSCGGLSEIACNDDQPGQNLTSRLSLPVTSGTTYLIEVTGYSTSGGGTLKFATDFVAPAPTPVCATTPEVCRTPVVPQKSKFMLKDKSEDSRDTLLWKWIKGPATTKAEFGDPRSTDTYELCIYDGTGLVSSATAPPGGLCSKSPCWKEKTLGFQYHDNTLSSGGLRTINLKEGIDGMTRIAVKARGANLVMPDLAALTSPLTVQLKRSGGPCWGAVYSEPFLKQDATQFKDKSD